MGRREIGWLGQRRTERAEGAAGWSRRRSCAGCGARFIAFCAVGRRCGTVVGVLVAGWGGGGACTDLLRLLLRYCVAASPAAPAHERETPEGEYADEASSSANTRTATRKAITRDNSSNLISLLSRQLTSSHASDLFAAGIARGTMRKVVSTRHPFYSSPRACV